MKTIVFTIDLCSNYTRIMQQSTDSYLRLTDSHPVDEESDDGSARSLSKYYIWWIFLDGSLFVVIVVGNILTVLAVRLNRRLRDVTSNLFVLNLAVSDLMVGLTLPYHLAFYLDKRLGEREVTCILRFVMINLACSASIYNLITIAVDRYIAVVHPLRYARHVNKTTVTITILVGWTQSIAVATVPIYWNCFDENSVCELETVLPR